MGMPNDTALASRFIDLGNGGYAKRAKAPRGKEKGSMGRPAAWWVITPKGENFIKDNADSIKTVEQLLADQISYAEATGRGGSKSSNQGIALNKKANTAIDSISQLIEDYNKSHGVLKQIHGLITAYLKDNRPENEG